MMKEINFINIFTEKFSLFTQSFHFSFSFTHTGPKNKHKPKQDLNTCINGDRVEETVPYEVPGAVRDSTGLFN